MIKKLLPDLIRVTLLSAIIAMIIEYMDLKAQYVTNTIFAAVFISIVIVIVNKILDKSRIFKSPRKANNSSRSVSTIDPQYTEKCLSIGIDSSKNPIILLDQDFTVLMTNESAKDHFIGLVIGVDITETIIDEDFSKALDKAKKDKDEVFILFVEKDNEYQALISPILYSQDIYHYFVVCQNAIKKRGLQDDKLMDVAKVTAQIIESASNDITILAEEISDKTNDASIKSTAITIHTTSAAIVNAAREIIGLSSGVAQQQDLSTIKTTIPEAVLKSASRSPRGKGNAIKHR